MTQLSTNSGFFTTVKSGFVLAYPENMEYIEFAQRLKRLMPTKGIENQKQLAEFVGKSTSIVSEWLRAEKLPSMDTALVICKKFDVNLNWLMLNNGPMHPSEEISNPLCKVILRLSPEQQKQIETYVAFIASQTLETPQQPDQKPLTTDAPNAGGGKIP